MAGNAHARRQRRRASVAHKSDCRFCANRPKVAKAEGFFRNTNGHRHNPARKRRGKRPVKK